MFGEFKRHFRWRLLKVHVLQPCWMRWLPHATACVHGTYVVCYSKGIQWCWRPYQLRGEMKQLVVQWTGTLDEFHHNYDDFYHFNSYGGCVGLRWSSDSAGQTTHILQTIRAKRRNGQYIRVSETWTEQLDQRLWILQVLLSPWPASHSSEISL